MMLLILLQIDPGLDMLSAVFIDIFFPLNPKNYSLIHNKIIIKCNIF